MCFAVAWRRSATSTCGRLSWLSSIVTSKDFHTCERQSWADQQPTFHRVWGLTADLAYVVEHRSDVDILERDDSDQNEFEPIVTVSFLLWTSLESTDSWQLRNYAKRITRKLLLFSQVQQR